MLNDQETRGERERVKVANQWMSNDQLLSQNCVENYRWDQSGIRKWCRSLKKVWILFTIDCPGGSQLIWQYVGWEVRKVQKVIRKPKHNTQSQAQARRISMKLATWDCKELIMTVCDTLLLLAGLQPTPFPDTQSSLDSLANQRSDN